MFHTYVCKCFYLDVTYILQWLFKCFSGVFAKVDRVLYMSQCDSPATAACCICWDIVHACGKQRMERSMAIAQEAEEEARGAARAVPVSK
jgi:hypothetical protein